MLMYIGVEGYALKKPQNGLVRANKYFRSDLGR